MACAYSLFADFHDPYAVFEFWNSAAFIVAFLFFLDVCLHTRKRNLEKMLVSICCVFLHRFVVSYYFTNLDVSGVCFSVCSIIYRSDYGVHF